MFYRLFAASALVLSLVACSTTAQPASPRVLAAEPFLADIAQNVAGERMTVESLLPPGVDAHEFQPAPRDAIKIDGARILIVNGLGYETWLKSALAEGGAGQTLVVATRGLTSNPDPSGTHPDGDPHMWMDPLNVVHYVENIRDGLASADPAGKEVYSANAAAYIAKLNDLDAWIKSQVAQVPPDKRLLVTSHDSLGYFAQAYGFKVVGAVIPSVTDEASPSAQQMAGLIDLIKSTRAPAIFLDATENQNLARQIASATGAKVVNDLYVETLSGPGGPASTYIDMLRHDVTSIVEALR